jgi:hypothetical protein
MANAKRIHQLLNRHYSICDELSQECDGRPCTPSGFCVGTPGEFLAADAFGLKLLPGNSKDFDAQTDLGEPVQIRTSGKGAYVPIYGGEGLLLVVKIRKTTLELIYGGPALHAWNAAREPNHRGTRSIGISTLKRLHAELPAALRMAKVRTVDRETHEDRLRRAVDDILAEIDEGKTMSWPAPAECLKYQALALASLAIFADHHKGCAEEAKDQNDTAQAMAWYSDEQLLRKVIEMVREIEVPAGQWRPQQMRSSVSDV